MRRKTEIVSFRADASLLARLDTARGQLSLSRGELVRELTIAHFHQHEADAELPGQLADLRAAIEEVAQLISPLADNQRRSLFILLTTVGKLDPTAAKEIVKCKLQS